MSLLRRLQGYKKLSIILPVDGQLVELIRTDGEKFVGFFSEHGKRLTICGRPGNVTFAHRPSIPLRLVNSYFTHWKAVGTVESVTL